MAQTTISRETLLGAYEVRRMMLEAVRDAQQESRDMGVPISFDHNGHTYFELPDGSLVPEDPWHGQNTPPEDWAWRDRWEKNVAEMLEERRKKAANPIDDD